MNKSIEQNKIHRCSGCRYRDNPNGTYVLQRCVGHGSGSSAGVWHDSPDGERLRVQQSVDGQPFVYPVYDGRMTIGGKHVFGTVAFYDSRPDIEAFGVVDDATLTKTRKKQYESWYGQLYLKKEAEAWRSRVTMETNICTGYSAVACGWLVVDGVQHELCQVGPDFCILRQPIPSGFVVTNDTQAELLIEVDGDRRGVAVLLQGVDPVSPGKLRYLAQAG